MFVIGVDLFFFGYFSGDLFVFFVGIVVVEIFKEVELFYVDGVSFVVLVVWLVLCLGMKGMDIFFMVVVFFLIFGFLLDRFWFWLLNWLFIVIFMLFSFFLGLVVWVGVLVRVLREIREVFVVCKVWKRC